MRAYARDPAWHPRVGRAIIGGMILGVNDLVRYIKQGDPHDGRHVRVLSARPRHRSGWDMMVHGYFADEPRVHVIDRLDHFKRVRLAGLVLLRPAKMRAGDVLLSVVRIGGVPEYGEDERVVSTVDPDGVAFCGWVQRLSDVDWLLLRRPARIGDVLHLHTGMVVDEYTVSEVGEAEVWVKRYPGGPSDRIDEWHRWTHRCGTPVNVPPGVGLATFDGDPEARLDRGALVRTNAWHGGEPEPRPRLDTLKAKGHIVAGQLDKRAIEHTIGFAGRRSPNLADELARLLHATDPEVLAVARTRAEVEYLGPLLLSNDAAGAAEKATRVERALATAWEIDDPKGSRDRAEGRAAEMLHALGRRRGG